MAPRADQECPNGTENDGSPVAIARTLCLYPDPVYRYPASWVFAPPTTSCPTQSTPMRQTYSTLVDPPPPTPTPLHPCHILQFRQFTHWGTVGLCLGRQRVGLVVARAGRDTQGAQVPPRPLFHRIILYYTVDGSLVTTPLCK